MATSRSTMFLFVLLAVVATMASALQVSSGSPCESSCTDKDSSISTSNDEITCIDSEFGSKPAGQKFERCVSCLQDSTYVHNGESDQEWFLYNMRYSIDYCVFGYPNAKEVDSSPCIIDEACGTLKTPLITGIKSPSQSGMYDYCGNDGATLVGDASTKCLECVQASGNNAYLSNFLIALEAGCDQQPAAGVLLGLNSTVFTKDTVEIVDPSAPLTDAPTNVLTTPAIAGIAVGGFVLLLLAAGCVFMQCRKRRNRANRANRRIRSSLSFRCMTHLTPRTPEFHFQDERTVEEKGYADPAAALGSNPVSGRPVTVAPWDAQWDVQHVAGAQRMHSKLSSITTSLPTPPPVHTSPQRMSPDDYATPTSTTSVRSNAPLLYQQQLQQPRNYSPGGYTSSPQQVSNPMFNTGLAVSTQSSSPNLSNGRGDVAWGEPQGRDLVKKKGNVPVGRPVQINNIQTKFPPPPKR